MNEMTLNYTGVKDVSATPMTRQEYNDYRGCELLDNENCDDEGYLVEYLDGGKPNHLNHGGYISWSPKEVFEKSYFRIEYDQDEYDEMSVPDLASTLVELKKNLDKAGELKTALQKAYDFLSINVLPERMDEEKIQTLKIKDLGRLQAKSDIRCNVLAGNRDDLKKWLVDHGHGSMIAESINASTLKAFVKEQMKEDNGEYPEELVNVEVYSRATVVKR